MPRSVRHWAQQRVPAPNKEIREQAFYSADALPADAADGTRRRIGEVLRGAQGSELW